MMMMMMMMMMMIIIIIISLLSWSKISPHFTEHDIPLRFPQKPDSFPYPETDKSSFMPPPIWFNIHFNIIIPSTHMSSKRLISSKCPKQIPVCKYFELYIFTSCMIVHHGHLSWREHRVAEPWISTPSKTRDIWYCKMFGDSLIHSYILRFSTFIF